MKFGGVDKVNVYFLIKCQTKNKLFFPFPYSALSMSSAVAIYHAIDIEVSNRRIGPNRIMRIGTCVLEHNVTGRGPPPQVLMRFGQTIDWGVPLEYDEDTRRFWAMHPEALVKNTANGLPVHTVARNLQQHLADVQSMAVLRGAAYTMVTDNIGFDKSWVDWLLSTYTDTGLPRIHNSVTGYMNSNHFVDISQRISGLDDIGIRWRPNTGILHDHIPEHDAEDLARQFAQYVDFIRKKLQTGPSVATEHVRHRATVTPVTASAELSGGRTVEKPTTPKSSF